MQEIIQGNAALISALVALCPEEGGVKHTTDMDGNAQHWFTLKTPVELPMAAAALKEAHARLALISGYRNHSDDRSFSFAACYHFELEGVVYNVTAHVSEEYPAVPTITPWFFNADWHEREMQELVGVKVKDQPSEERLFLDPELDRGVLGKMVPLSVMMNGACSTDLWEHILAEKGGKL